MVKRTLAASKPGANPLDAKPAKPQARQPQTGLEDEDSVKFLYLAHGLFGILLHFVERNKSKVNQYALFEDFVFHLSDRLSSDIIRKVGKANKSVYQPRGNDNEYCAAHMLVGLFHLHFESGFIIVKRPPPASKSGAEPLGAKPANPRTRGPRTRSKARLEDEDSIKFLYLAHELFTVLLAFTERNKDSVHEYASFTDLVIRLRHQLYWDITRKIGKAGWDKFLSQPRDDDDDYSTCHLLVHYLRLQFEPNPGSHGLFYDEE